ncbi:MAG: YibE/F family protein [Candidatus Altimarinota bacterium]
MKRALGWFVSALMFCVILPTVRADGGNTETVFVEDFYRAQVQEILREGEEEYLGNVIFTQWLLVELLEGQDQGMSLELPYRNSFGEDPAQKMTVGEKVIVVKTAYDGESSYRFFERYRLRPLWVLFFFFIGITLLVSGKRGLGSLLGLAVTLVILTKWLVPQIVSGGNPILVSFFGSVVIASLSLFLAHGFHKRTVISWVSLLITLGISLLLALFSVSFAHLFGMGSEEAINLTFGMFDKVDLKGLLLGAIVIGALGILDDVVTTQVATVAEIHDAHSTFSFWELYRRGLSVGKEHIASLVNTLVIAYAGASLPVFLFITTSENPLWVILNNEFMAEEIVRTLVGSTTLILAVPISTFLAAYVYTRRTVGRGQHVCLLAKEGIQ